VELGDLILESLNDLSGFLFFILGSLDKLPALLDFSSEDSDSVGIFLSQLNGSLDSRSVLENSVVQFFTSFD